MTALPVATYLPAGYAKPNSIASDPSAPGVWFTAALQGEVDLFHVVSPGLISQTIVLSHTQVAAASSVTSQIAVTPSGQVWLSLGLTLYHFDPSTGSIDTISLPAILDNNTAQSFLPAGLKGFHFIRTRHRRCCGRRRRDWCCGRTSRR